jgi:hypothetical protein
MTRRGSTLLVAAIVMVGWAPALRAEPDADAEATALFDEGRVLMREGRFSEACPKFEKSQRMNPHSGTLLNLAACHERVGKIGTAWVEFHQALTAARVDGKEDKARLAEERIAALEPRLPWLSVNVSRPPPDTIVEVDGSVIARAAWGKEMPVDPGEHRLIVSAPGAVTVDRRISIPEGGRSTIEFELELSGPRSADVAPPPRDAADRETKTGPRHARGRIVAELGAFAGILHGGGASAGPSGDDVILTSANGQQANCANESCAYSLGEAEALISGGAGFLGYAATERLELGFRGLGGFRAGGGFVIAVGPAVSARVLGPIWVGASFVLGDVLERGSGSASLQNATTSFQSPAPVQTHTGLTVGNGIELGLSLFETDSGALFVETTPVFLVAQKHIIAALPLVVGYRFF